MRKLLAILVVAFAFGAVVTGSTGCGYGQQSSSGGSN